LAEARALDALEELLGHDLVGVDVGAVEEADRPGDDSYRIHQLQLLMSTKWPSIAAAAAICGETRWVRPPRPWRPSKLRFEVEAQRSPGALTCWEPGTTIASTLGATLRPAMTSAAARRSPMRELVQDPMNTRSSAICSIGVPGSRPMY